MVLPEFQGRGLGKRAVRMLLEMARDDGRWGLVHAFPATTNAPSNGICRSLGFRFAGERGVTFAGRVLRNPLVDVARGNAPDARVLIRRQSARVFEDLGAIEILDIPSRTIPGHRRVRWLSHHCHAYITTTGTAFIPLHITTHDSRLWRRADTQPLHYRHGLAVGLGSNALWNILLESGPGALPGQTVRNRDAAMPMVMAWSCSVRGAPASSLLHGP